MARMNTICIPTPSRSSHIAIGMHLVQAGLQSRSRPEPKLLAGAGAGAGILKFRLRLPAPAPGQTKVVYLIIIHIE
jgi:hypothetical protein